ncbi:MAG: BREX system P-loop protein BrxC [Thermoleophilaceae bacterium]
MKIRELFRGDIARPIETVIHVDLSDEATVAHEIEEYVVTENIREHVEELADVYADTARNPSESTNVWVSGFFGSGKSSFAKTVGYALADPVIEGRTATDRLLARANSHKLEALLNTAHTVAPTIAVFLDLASGRDMLREGESLVLPVYRGLLKRLGYSSNELLAELEITLEAEGRLEVFETAVLEATDGRPWAQVRDVALSKNYASRALHLIDLANFPSADSWARAATAPSIDHNWLARRALELLGRRGAGATRLVFVVDEVGQYVARSIQRMFDLQGLAEAFQKKRGPLWLVVTSQERLSDVVDSLESRQVEYARVQDRFPLRVDLLPSDIHEVTSRRVLDKTEAGQSRVREALAAHRNQLNAHVRLESPTRAADIAEDEFVRLYPLLPYQVQLLIDAVSARRAQGGGSPMLGGSNRTIIKLAQQLVVDPSHGLGNDDVGALITLDRAAQLLEEAIPTSWRHEIEQVADRYGDDGVETQVMQAVALCSDVPALPLTEANLAVLLHDRIGGESRRPEVADALARLVADDRLRAGDEGYHIQSPEQKDWEKSRRGKEPRPADSIRIRKALVRQALAGLSVTKGRSFKVELWVDGEKLSDGEVALHIEEADGARRDQLRTQSREDAAKNRVSWVYSLSENDTYHALVEFYRSDEMIKAKDTPSKTAAEVELLGEERQRLGRVERQLADRLSRDLTSGQVIFRGKVDEAPAGTLMQSAQTVVTERISEIYDRLDSFAAQLSTKDVMTVLRTDDLGTVNEALAETGIGLVRLTPHGHQFATDTSPLDDLLKVVMGEMSFGHAATGALLAKELAAPPRGAPVEVVQVLAAAALRSGLLEVTYQGSKIGDPSDHRLERVFGRINDFRGSSFAPPTAGPSVEMRVELAANLGKLTGANPPIDAAGLAGALRDFFAADGEACSKIGAGLMGAGLPVPDAVTRLQNIVASFRRTSDADTVTTAVEAWVDLTADHETICNLVETLDEDLPLVRRARAEVHAGQEGLPTDASSAVSELADLLAAGDLLSHRGAIKDLTLKVRDARSHAAAEAAARVTAKLEEARTAIRARFAEMDDGKVDEALRQLDQLAPPAEPTTVPLGDLLARVELVEPRTENTARVLEELQAAGNLARVRVMALVSEPITTEEELDIALERIRQAAVAELAEGKQVRLQ